MSLPLVPKIVSHFAILPASGRGDDSTHGQGSHAPLPMTRSLQARNLIEVAFYQTHVCALFLNYGVLPYRRSSPE